MSQSHASTTQTPLVAALIGAVFALGGAFPMPYSYYQTMRLVIAAACVVIAFGAIARRKPIATVPPVVIAIFFIFVKGLAKEAWLAIDLVTAVVLIGLGGWLSRQPVHE